MKRNISIGIDSKTDKPNVVHINNLSSLVNYSCDSISIDILEFLQEKDHEQIIKYLLEKLRPNGKLIITINNAKNIAKDYAEAAISSGDFLQLFSNKQSLLTIESIYTFIDFQTFDIVNIDVSPTQIIAVVERKNI